jgi:DNA-binding GntR family transcriptional regulator
MMIGSFSKGDPRSTIVDTVYDNIRKMIIYKELVIGQKLSEIGLSEHLGVSRTPVHEALRRLSNEGYVLIVPKSGAWVASPTKQEIEDAYAVRCKLECWAASMAAAHVTPLFLAQLDEKIAIEDKLFKARSLESYLEVNNNFHMIIASASANTVLIEYIKSILSKTFIYMVFMERFFDLENNPSLDEHKQIREAFTLRDSELCVQLMEIHIKKSLSDLRI